MDFLHLLHWCFLLLALAAPHPNIAMSSDDPAKGTKDSSSGNTNVTVYHCKNCESSMCQTTGISFENFEIIAETRARLFSDGTIELVTREKNIIACFKQENRFLEGIFGIAWEKAGGLGASCGTLNSEENGRDNISAEEKKICCKAETDVWKHNPTLKCYTEKSGPEPTTPPTETKYAESRKPLPDISGNPEFLTSKKSSIGILFAFLFVGVLTGWVTMYYFFRLHRGQAFRHGRWASDRENLTHV